MSDMARNYDADQLVKLDGAHHLHPFTDSRTMAAAGGTRVITRADGIYLTDAHGERILDAMAGLWCVNIGYGWDELAEVAWRQMRELPYYNSFFMTANPPSIELSAVVADLLPAHFNKLFFSNSGSEANDTNLRLVHHYWQAAGRPEKRFVISRDMAYHGSTIAGSSLGGFKKMHAQGGKLIPTIHHIAPPYGFKYAGDMNEDDFGRHSAGLLEAKIRELGAENVAAFIGEPVMGAGGVLIPPANYWAEIQDICRKHDVLLICDEVICGFGRTGNWFGFETFDINPDLITMAKGLSSGYMPVSATALSDRIADCIIAEGGEFSHGYTYSGHPVACAVALKNIEIMQREGLVEKVAKETGPHLARAIRRLDDHPLVGETRSCGLLGAIELVSDKKTRARFQPAGRAGKLMRDWVIGHHVMMRACEDTMVMSPPLIIETHEIDRIIDAAEMALDETAAALGVT